MAIIDFFTFNHKDSYKYIEFQKKIAEKLLSGKHSIKWKCIESVQADKIPEGYAQLATTPYTGHNSHTHAIAINRAVELVEEKYVIIVDGDVAILYEGWDDLVVQKLNSGIACFGGSYHDETPRYKDFPCVYFFAYRSDMLGPTELDFRPEVEIGKDPVKRLTVRTPEQSQCFNRPVGYQIKCDTGWKLPLLIRPKLLRGEAMKCFHSRDKGSLLPYRDKKQKKFCQQKPTHMAEWQYGGKLFGTHKQASRSHPLSSEWGCAWKDRIELFLERMG